MDKALLKSFSSFNKMSFMFLINGKMTHGRTRAMIEDIYRRGGRSVIPIPSNGKDAKGRSIMGSPYLSEEYFEQYGNILEECKRLSMELWVWDELYCPSGRAGGMLLEKHPHLRARHLEKKRSSEVDKSIESIAYSKGDWVYSVCKLQGDKPALTDAGVGQAFIGLTHQGYKRHFKKYFGTVIKGFFCDEPCNFSGPINGYFNWRGVNYKTAIPWPADIERIFEERFGYPLEDVVPFLFYYHGKHDTAVRAREDFARIITEMYRDNFLLPLKEWCNKNGLLSSGHFNNDDILERHLLATGDLMVQLKTFDVPGIDIICQQIMPEKEKAEFSPKSWNAFPYNTNMAKFASSASRQTGGSVSLTEIMATYGCGITIEETKWVIDHHLIRGVNFFAPTSTDYVWGADGLDFVAAFGFDSPQWLFMDDLNEYYNEISGIMLSEKDDIDVAVWYPISSLWREKIKDAGLKFEAFMEYLLANATDFDIVSPNEIDSFIIGRKYLNAGCAKYSKLVIPCIGELSIKERDFVERLAKNIEVYAPDTLCLKNCIAYTAGKPEPYHRKDNPLLKFAFQIYSDLGKKMSIKPLNKNGLHLRSKRFKTSKGVVHFIFNESGEKSFKGYIEPEGIEGDAKVLRFSRPMKNGAIIRQNGKKGYYISLEPQETIFFAGKEALSKNFTVAEAGNRKVIFTDRWNLSVNSEIGWNEKGYYLEKDGIKKTALIKDLTNFSDWKDLFQKSFSGSVSYKNRFFLGGPACLYLSLEELGYAVKVYVNGCCAGSIAWKPYRLVIPEKFTRKGVNEIELVVYNTLANIARRPDTKNIKRQLGQASNYYIYSGMFDRLRLKSGISGVILKK